MSQSSCACWRITSAQTTPRHQLSDLNAVAGSDYTSMANSRFTLASADVEASWLVSFYVVGVRAFNHCSLTLYRTLDILVCPFRLVHAE